MKKTIVRIWNTIVFRFVNRKVCSVLRGGFKYTFRKYSMDVETLSRNFSFRVLCTEHPYGYLRASLEQDKLDNLDGYATLMYIVGTMLTKDQKMVSDLTRDVQKYFDRVERAAKKSGESDSDGVELGILMSEYNSQMKKYGKK